MAGDAPLVSVVMSVYNDGPFIKEAVSSILQQSFGDFEFIIIDDGSIDDSVKTVRKFDDSRIRLIRQENRGLAAALNRGIGEARGRYIARQDGDDVSEVNRLEMQVQHLERDTRIVLLGCNITFIEESGRILGTSDFPLDDDSLQHRLLYNDWERIPFYHGAVMFRKAEAYKAGLYRPQFTQAQDLDFFLRLAENGRLANIPAAGYRWRLRRTSINNTKWENQRDYGRLARVCALQRRRGETEPAINLESVQRPFLRSALSRLRRASPEVEYEFNLAKLLLHAGKTSPAREYLCNVIRKQPSNIYAWLLLLLAALPPGLTKVLWGRMRTIYRTLIWTRCH